MEESRRRKELKKQHLEKLRQEQLERGFPSPPLFEEKTFFLLLFILTNVCE